MKLLIIGASILQLPAIKKAKEMGCYVGVADYNPNAIGIPYADEYFNVSTIDIDRVVETARRFKPDGIITLATDMPMRSIAKACEVCGLPSISFDTAVRATDKAEMIKAFEAHGVEHPWYYVVKDENDIEAFEDSLKYPCIMKPTDNAGSRGVVLCHSFDELKREYSYSRRESRGGTVIIEEYLVGPEFSVEVIVIDGEPHVLQITDKLTTGAPHFVEMGHSQPTSQSPENREKIRDLAVRACKAVGISCGPAHVEMILTENGPKMVELGARMGGDCITTHLVPLSTGVDMIKATIDIACGVKPDIEPKFSRGSAIRYLNVNPGVISSVKGVDDAKAQDGVEDVAIVHGIGETVGEIGSSIDRVGFVIASGDSAKQAIERCAAASELIKITVS